MSGALDTFIAAAPPTRRATLRLLLALERRPRGAALLARVPAAQQVAFSLVALGRYDEPALARSLGWDAEAVVRRGRELRRAEGRP